MDEQSQLGNFDNEATNDLSIIADQLKMVLETQFEIKVTKETAEFVIEHIYSGLIWIFKKANTSTEKMGIYVQDFGETQAAIIDGGNGQILLINPKVFAQIEAISQQIKGSELSIEDLEITLESKFNEVPKIDCSLIDFLESIGLEEGAHYIQGLVSSGQNISGFEKMAEATRIHTKSGEDEQEVIRKYLAERDHLDEQTKPHEINAKYWVNEYFKEKYNGKSPWENFYQALKKIAEKKNPQKKRFNILKAFGMK